MKLWGCGGVASGPEHQCQPAPNAEKNQARPAEFCHTPIYPGPIAPEIVDPESTDCVQKSSLVTTRATWLPKNALVRYLFGPSSRAAPIRSPDSPTRRCRVLDQQFCS